MTSKIDNYCLSNKQHEYLYVFHSKQYEVNGVTVIFDKMIDYLQSYGKYIYPVTNKKVVSIRIIDNYVWIKYSGKKNELINLEGKVLDK